MDRRGEVRSRGFWIKTGLAALPLIAGTVVASCGGGCCTAPPFFPGPAGSPTPTPAPIPSGFVSVGVALVGNDGSGTNGIAFLKIEDSAGNALPVPTFVFMPIANAGDLDGQGLTPDAKQGVAMDGGDIVYFFSGTQNFAPVLSPSTINVSAFGGDGDAVDIHPNGDEAVASADDPCTAVGAPPICLVVISGISSGSPVLADTVSLPDFRDSLTMSIDGKVLLARGDTGLTVFSVATVASHTGSQGGPTTLSFTQTADLASAANFGFSSNGRGGMAICPTDSSRAVVINAPSAGMVSLLTGLPSSPVLTSIPIRLPLVKRHVMRAPRPERHAGKLSITPTGVTSLNAVSVTPGCKFAYIGTDAGIVTVSGVDTGTLAQVGSPFNPSYTVGGVTHQMNSVPTLAITLDGKFIAAFSSDTSPGTELTLGIGAGGALSVVGQFNPVDLPFNDQAIAH